MNSVWSQDSVKIDDSSVPKSSLVSRNITVLGRRTSIRLEPEMWSSLREIAKRESCKIHDICSLVYVRKKEGASLTAAIRVFIMLYFRAATTEDGHNSAGHGNFEKMMERARMTKDLLREKAEQVEMNRVKAQEQEAARPSVYNGSFYDQSDSNIDQGQGATA